MLTETTTFAARHSMDSPEWYTPSPFVEAARDVMRGIDLDPASHEEANRTVKAARFFTADDDGLSQLWNGRVFLNPPGGKDKNRNPLVPQFWQKLVHEYHRGAVTDAIWIGYSLEQLQTLQGCLSMHPIDYPFCIPSRRIAFVENEAKKAERIAKAVAAGKDPNEKSQPSHANYITYLGRDAQRFRMAFGKFGVVRI